MSSNSTPLKIVVCGPVGSGKTSIVNFLAGQKEQIGNANKIHEATVGVRQAYGGVYSKGYTFTENSSTFYAQITCASPHHCGTYLPHVRNVDLLESTCRRYVGALCSVNRFVRLTD